MVKIAAQETLRSSFTRFLSGQLNSHTFLQLQITLSVFVFLVLFFSSPVLLAQQISMSEKGSLVKSMGLPHIWKPYFGPMVAWDNRGVDGTVAGELNLGIYKDVVHPDMGLLGVAGEGYVRSGGDKIDGGVRLLTASKFLFIQGGIDYSFRNEDLNFLMSFIVPLRRGGFLGKGESLRLDWLPGRSHSFSVGLSIPLGQPYLGKTRPT